VNAKQLARSALQADPEHLKKYCSHAERGFLGFGEALAKEHPSVVGL
jgi:hypothetical protein